ncbi:16S rRNA (guanine(966)-N(2))-methyltransferase RsmD [Clostridium rectalis]|uniref:16S rRNA (guanine(966)-N(2))-methyltransferase RsmD n=1 Tax=Clostridium rectalis TaxID=2040295 RepID=UPI000F6333F7|nr:16S rRNA (guanine(966)-N(2))-methyltransferase RsmD [Clostridium rectalis]
MRIIAGLARGRKLLSPEGMGTRPTLDRVKENIFNIIQNYIYDSVAIDVFAGTGSLGLEAVSRGAKECHLIDKGATTFKYLEQNVKNFNFEDKCVCHNMDSYEALKMFGKQGKKFDIIFLDPPYLKDMIPLAAKIIEENNMLNKDGIIVSKIDSSEKIFQGTEKLTLTQDRKYGNTTICFYKHKED